LVILGITPSELEHLKQGQPLNILLESNLFVAIIPGESNEELVKVAQQAADRLEAQSKGKSVITQLPKGIIGRTTN
jgi:hypothetical protein